MSEKVCCHSCAKEFDYESEIVGGATKNITNEKEDLGMSRGIFSNKSSPKKQNTLLACPHCKNEDYYKVTVG